MLKTLAIGILLVGSISFAAGKEAKESKEAKDAKRDPANSGATYTCRETRDQYEARNISDMCGGVTAVTSGNVTLGCCPQGGSSMGGGGGGGR